MSVYYIGTNAGKEPVGIYSVVLKDGHLSEPRLQATLRNPNWIEIDSQKNILYAVESTSMKDGRWHADGSGRVHSFKIEDDYSLKPISSVSSGGAYPCYLWCCENHILVANYGGGLVASIAVDKDGVLSDVNIHAHVDTDKDRTAHAHQIIGSADKKWFFACDLGLDKIYISSYDEDGLHAVDDFTFESRGSGPRHMVLHPSEPLAYVLHETTGALDILHVDGNTGKLRHLRRLDLPGHSASDLRWHGRFLYAGLRSENAITLIDCFHPKEPQIVETQLVGGMPRGFAVSDDGESMLIGNQKENLLALYQRQLLSGRISERMQAVSIPAPVCVCSLAQGHRPAVLGTTLP